MSATFHIVRPTITACDDVSATAKHMRRATSAFELATQCSDPDQAYVMVVEDLEGALFHLLTHLGCRKADRELRQLLNRRQAAREVKHG